MLLPIRIGLILVVGFISQGEAADSCFDNTHPETGLYASCIQESSCTSGEVIQNACPSFPSDYICCFNSIFPGRELRGAWIATVDNIDFPKSPTSSVATQQAELATLIDTLELARINAVYFQVRPAGDALYISDIEPWSRYLTGTQGTAPSPVWDPLAFVISYCHERNIEVHAWINPYRANLQNSPAGLAPNHMAILYPQYAYPYSTYLWMDPAAEVVQNRTYEVAVDLVTRYDLDGLHMDDYFYPYPVAGEEFPDSATYNEYVASGGTLAKDDWRRDNVNKLVERMNTGIHAAKPSVSFSVSPFGIYRAGHPEGMPSPIAGFDQYSEIYCDPKLWLQQGWIDALQPQLYWKIDPPAQSYPILLDWWGKQNTLGRHIYAGNFLSRIAVDNGDWSLDEIRNQVVISHSDSNRMLGSWGNIMFSAKILRDNVKGSVGFFNTFVYAYPALTPPLTWLNTNATKLQVELNEASTVSVKGSRVTLQVTSDTNITKVVVYLFTPTNGWQIVKVVRVENKTIDMTLSAGRYATSGLDRFGVESKKVFFRV